jgi:hypothetical protein
MGAESAGRRFGELALLLLPEQVMVLHDATIVEPVARKRGGFFLGLCGRCTIAAVIECSRRVGEQDTARLKGARS